MEKHYPNKLLLIDGNSIMNRGYYAIPNTLTNSEGLHTNAILGFLNIFFKVYGEEKPTNIIVAFDVHEPTFRHKIYADYKGTRHGMDDELREQFPVIKELLSTMNITCVEKGGFEADDLIGTYSRLGESQGMDVSILSGDRDLLQLSTDKILVRIPKTSKGQTTVYNYYAKDVEEEYGVTPLEFIEMKGLMGDTSDNIPGVSGIGPKTASNIISKYHSIEAALDDIDNIKPDKARKNLDEQRDMALFSRDLATIKLDVDVDVDVKDTNVTEEDIYSKKVYDAYLNLGLRSLLNRFDNKQVNDDSANDQSVDKNIESEDINYSDLISLINNSNEKQIGLAFYFVEGLFYHIAVAVGDKVYIVPSTDPVTNIRKDIREDITISFISIKEAIETFSLDESDNLFDASVASYILDPPASKYDYCYIASRYLGIEYPDESSLIEDYISIKLYIASDEHYRKLLGYSAYTALKCMEPLKNSLRDKNCFDLYNNIEYPVIFVLDSMEKYGIRVDKDTLAEYGVQLDVKINELTNKIYELAGKEFNINSTKQLGVVLFEDLGLKSGKKTKSGYSTSVDVLNKLKDDHEIVRCILEYRSVSKLKSTYVDGLIGTIKNDGRIHSKFNQKVTATGRLSSTDPNLQNIPTRTAEGREIRKCFIPSDGYTYVDADYSQIELRVMASISKDESLIEAFNSSKDIHAITASQVFGVPLDEVDSSLRRRAKAVNFGIIYGISSFGLGEDLGISRSEAKEYIEKYFATYSKVKEYLDSCVESAKETGYVSTLYGRIRPIPELKSSNFMQRSFGERVAMNSPIQGTAADIIKIAMIKVYEELKSRNLKSRLILQIHDELLIETALDEVDIVKELLKTCMETAVSLAVPLYVDVHTGDSLYDAK